MRLPAILSRLAPVPVYFALRIASALLLLKLSASFLPVSGFAVFSQLMLFASLLNLVAIGGTQNGLIRQAAAAEDKDALARRQSAALLIWAGAFPLLALSIIAASGHISTILVGTRDEWPVVIAIALLALAAGPGQVWCSILSGRKHVAASLTAQALGLLTSTAIAAWLISRGAAIPATIGFASGSLVTMTVSFLFAAKLHIPFASPRVALPEVRSLLRYSVAFATTTGFTSILLFGLRSLYRESFSATMLGYWIAANRISDMSTQLLGLFMIQFFVPHFAMMETEAARRRLVLRCWAAGVAGMAVAVTIFSVASRPLVHLFLSDAFLPAIPAIRLYMLGDLLRVWVSLAMYTAFASGKPGRYAGMEIATLATMGVITVLFISAGEAQAPQFGYVGAYAIAAAAVTLAFLWRSLGSRPFGKAALQLP
jgi:O-antigen/teichoic acid export membrane protein